MTVHRFRTVLDAEGSGVFIEVPLDVPAVFGRARATVRAPSTATRSAAPWPCAAARRAETRRRRVEQAAAMLRDGRRHP
jgi:hypothetical protein